MELSQVLEKTPTLNSLGIGTDLNQYGDEFNTCKDWWNFQIKAKEINTNRNLNVYELYDYRWFKGIYIYNKDKTEKRWIIRDRRIRNNFPIGIFIAAGIATGYKYKINKYGNVVFNISNKSVAVKMSEGPKENYSGFWFYGEDDLPHLNELHKMTKERDGFDFGFKMDEEAIKKEQLDNVDYRYLSYDLDELNSWNSLYIIDKNSTNIKYKALIQYENKLTIYHDNGLFGTSTEVPIDITNPLYRDILRMIVRQNKDYFYELEEKMLKNV